VYDIRPAFDAIPEVNDHDEDAEVTIEKESLETLLEGR
jgi:hypothetical protein